MDPSSFNKIESDDQITQMLINELGAQLGSDFFREHQITVTPKLCATILFALCDIGNKLNNDHGVVQQRNDDIDQLADICREFLPSASPLSDVLQAIDSEKFVDINYKVIDLKSNKNNAAFLRFWQFSMNLCNTDKQGIAVIGQTFFGRVWTHNTEFQLGIVINCIKSNMVGKLLSVGPVSHINSNDQTVDLSQLVLNLDSLKCQPDFEAKKEFINWKFQRLYSILLEVGSTTCPKQQTLSLHTVYYNEIIDLFEWPVQNCPDLVALGVIGSNSNISNTCNHGCSSNLANSPSPPVSHVCKNVILSLTIPAFLSNHPNAAIILHTIWSCGDLSLQNVTSVIGSGGGGSVGSGTGVGSASWARQVLLQAMCDYYMKTSDEQQQQQRLSRILDVAQDLKALSLLLNSQCYPFVIDLACLASRREYLKLDKWLNDKIESCGEAFLQSCTAFLSRRTGLLNNKQSESGYVYSSLPSETLATIVACLQMSVSQQNTVNSLTSSNSTVNQSQLQSSTNLKSSGVTSSINSTTNAPPSLSLSPDLSEKISTMVTNSTLLMQKNIGGIGSGIGGIGSGIVGSGVVGGVVSNKSSLIGNSVNQTINDLNSLSLSNSNNNNNNNVPFGSSRQSALQQQQQQQQQPQQFPSLQSLGAQLSNLQSKNQINASLLTNKQSAGSGVGGGLGVFGNLQQQVAAKVQTANNNNNNSSNSNQLSGDSKLENTIKQTIGDLANCYPEMQVKMADEYEKESDIYFHKVFNGNSAMGSMKIDDLLEMLKRFKDSPAKKERDLLECMIRNIFREYCYLPRYPNNELLIMAQVFGGLIQLGIVKGGALVFALRYILECLKRTFGSNMYAFGLTALDKFKSKLPDLSIYCEHIKNIPHFNEFPRSLIECIESNASSSSMALQQSTGQVLSQLPMLNSTGLPRGSIGSIGSIGSVGSVGSIGSSLSSSYQSKFINNQSNAVGSIGNNNNNNNLTANHLNVSAAAVAAAAVASRATSGTTSTGSNASRLSIANSTNIDTLLAAGETVYASPPEVIQDKVAFVINNLSQINLNQKCEEFKEIMGSDELYWGWIAQYLVMKRVSIEPNFHGLYANFVEMVKVPELIQLCIKETSRNIKVLLRSDKDVPNFSDRSLLKNLGHWFGMLTLARNKPIHADQLNLKFLLIEAYVKGTQELLFVVPFVAKIIESSAKSPVFKPPSPFTMGILYTLVELHEERDMQLNLRFEVEVLCKNLGIDISEYIGKTNNLKNQLLIEEVMQEQQLGSGRSGTSKQQQQQQLQQQQQQQQQNITNNVTNNTVNHISGGGQDLSVSNLNVSSLPQSFNHQVASQLLKSGLVPGLNSNLQNLRLPQMLPSMMQQNELLSQNSSHLLHLANSGHMTSSQMSPPASVEEEHRPQPTFRFQYDSINVSSISFLGQSVRVPSLQLIQRHPSLQPWIRPTIEKTVQTWLPIVSERSIKITLTCAEQLIKKDFALEADEVKVASAAQCLIRNLTGAIALATARDPLLQSITSNLTSAFTAQLQLVGITPSQELIEATANAIALENLELCVCFTQKTAIEKAAIELDKRLAPEYEARRKTRAEGRRYCDAAALTYQCERMPEAIRFKVGSVTPQQFLVYQDLGKNIPGFSPSVSESSTVSLMSKLGVTSSLSSMNENQLNNMVMSQHFLPNNNTSSLMNNNSVNASFNSSSFPSLGIQGGTAPSTGPSQIPANSFNSETTNTVDTGLQILYDKLITELESQLQQFVKMMVPNQLIVTMHSVIEVIINSRNNTRDIVVAMSLIAKILEALAELIPIMNDTNIEGRRVQHEVVLMRARDLYLAVLRALAEPRAYGHQWTTKQVTKQILERIWGMSKNVVFPDQLFDLLMKCELIHVSFFDVQICQFIENPAVLHFTLQFFKAYGHQIHDYHVPNILAGLVKITKSNPTTPLAVEITQIIESFRTGGAIPGAFYGSTGSDVTNLTSKVNANTAVTTVNNSISRDMREIDGETPDLAKKTELLMREWITTFHSNTPINEYFLMFVQLMNQHGILKTDDSITKFFRLSTELCVDFCYRLLMQQNSNQTQIEIRLQCFQTLDAFAHLIVVLVKHSGTNMTESAPKLSLLNKVLGIIANVAIRDQELRNEAFQHLPYYRILMVLFMELTLGANNLGFSPVSNLQNELGFPLGQSQLESFYESVRLQVLNAFFNTLRLLMPSKAPSFAFAWLDFISHRTFMEKCLNVNNNSSTNVAPKSWRMYAQLLIDIIKFEAPFLRNVELPQSIDLLHKGTLKVLLVLLHDFPEFLCEYCYELCDAIPCNVIQMRNLVLSAFPQNMRLPDPFTPNLKIESLVEIVQPPKGTMFTIQALANVPFRKDLDSYLRTRSPVTFLSELRGYLQSSNNSMEPSRYNIPMMNALVLFVGQSSIQAISPKNISVSSISHSSHMDIFQSLAVDLDTEGRYLFLNAIANQLRYPNSHTHYFSCVLLYIFSESNTESIQEQITRVLLERLIVNRPHPWGLLVTFIELIKNPIYKFWSHEFVRCAPEIEKLFESVAKSCMQQQKNQANIAVTIQSK